MNTNEQEVIYNQHGEPTELAAPADFGNSLSFLNPSDMPDLDTAEVGFNIQPESIEFISVDQSIRAVFNGFTTFNVKDQVNEGQYVPRKTAVLQTKTGIKINMGANLIKQLDLIPVGTAIQITYKGEKKTNGGRKVKVYEVHTLNVPRSNFAPVSRPAPALPAVTQIEAQADEEPVIEIVDTMHFWAVTEAANHWNIEAGQAAKAISAAKLGKMEKSEFLEWLRNS